jgi:hypothetical protein
MCLYLTWKAEDSATSQIQRRSAIMSERVLYAFVAVAILTVANFLWQAVRGRDWGVAMERSFFQAVSIALYLAFGGPYFS